MKVVVDASVAVKWLFGWRGDEADAAAALHLLQALKAGDAAMVQPPHFLAEVAAVLAREAPARARASLADLLLVSMEEASGPSIHDRAVQLAIRLRQHVFDTLYHAVALHTPAATLVTADERYFRAAGAEGRIVRLRDWHLAA